MRALLVGSGGREHALAWKLAQAPSLTELHAAPGSPGIARLAECHPIRAEDSEGLLALAHALDIDLVVVGPEAPLVGGVADVLRPAGIAVFGPSAAAAAIEGSKAFAKDVMAAAGVPTAAQLAVARPPCVVKADGLAAGKGVHVCRSQAELDAALRAVTSLGGGVVVEELLEGPEVSLFALCDGGDAVPLVPAQDFKRAYDGDEGPNTGGMGSYAPVPGLDDAPRSSWSSSTARYSPSSSDEGRRSWASSSQASCSRRTGRACSSSTAASAIPRRSRCFRWSKAIFSRPLPPLPRGSVRCSPGDRARRAVTVVLAAGTTRGLGPRLSDHRGRGRRSRRRARLPRRHCPPWRPAGDERRSHPGSDRAGGDGRGCANGRVQGCGSD